MKPLSSLLIILLLFLNLNYQSIIGLELENDGGYHVSIGLGGEEPEDTETLLNTIEAEMEALSQLMFTSTENTFHIKSVSVIIPMNWSYSEIDAEAAEYSFAESDIKVWSGAQVPFVSRSTQCGHPGDEIILPISFFTATQQHSRERSLLHLWAQYRWGMFEESGFPHNIRFPYFIQNLEDGGDWFPNSCTDQPLSGTVSLTNGTTCSIQETEPPSPDCRFIPDDPQPEEIHSSLLTHYHHLMDSLCTNETHLVTLPTPHNIFCSWKSTWDVLQSCDDFQSVTVTPPVNSKRLISFSTLKESERPLINFIIDGRIMHQAPENVAGRIRSILRTLVDVGTGVDQNSLAAVTIFPSTTDHQVPIEKLISWTPILGSANDFRMAFDKISTLASSTAHFGTAIKLVSESIKARKHSAGGFIFIFKGISGSDFDEMPFEEEVLVSLLSHKIQVHALEMGNGPLDPGTNFLRLSNQSGGSHLTVTSTNLNTQDLENFIRNFVQETKLPNFVNLNFTTISMTMGNEVSAYKDTNGPLILSLTTSLDVSKGLRVIENSSGEEMEFLNKMNEWNEGIVQGRRRTFITNIPTLVQNETWRLQCRDEVDESDCRGFFVVLSPVENDISITHISTHFDEQGTGLLFIYAKLEQEGEPLVRLNSVGDYIAFAELCLQNNPAACWTDIQLIDNGAGIPDLLQDDGILSGALIPPPGEDIYNLRVSVSFFHKNNLPHHLNPSNNKTKAVDETIFPCSHTPDSPIHLCVGRVPESSFQVVSTLPHPITIIGQTSPKSEPTRTFDLQLITVADGGLILSWTAPYVFLPVNLVEAADSYDLRYCLDWDSLVQDFSNCAPVEVVPALPGSRESVFLPIEDPNTTLFFGLKSTYKDIHSELSNVGWGRPGQFSGSSPSISTTTTNTPPTDVTDFTDNSDTSETMQTTESSTPSTTEEYETEETTIWTDLTTERDDSSSTPTTIEDEDTTPNEDDKETKYPSTTDDSITTEESTTEQDKEEETTNPEMPETTEENEISSSTLPQTSDETSSTDDSSSEPTTEEEEETTTVPPTYSTLPPVTTEEPKYFFKTTVGYVTAGAIGLVCFIGLGAAIGGLAWKRRALSLEIAKSRSNHL